MKLSNLLRRDPAAPTLRERAAALRSGLSRRDAVLGVAAAAAVPLPAIASPEAISPEEAAFVALIPEALPLLRQYLPADAAWRALADEADQAAGPCPEIDAPREQHVAWADRASQAREANGYVAAWDAAHVIEMKLNALVEDYDLEPMRTHAAILFKVALSGMGEWWSESALYDLKRLAAHQFELSYDGLTA